MIHSHCIRQGHRKRARNVTETGAKSRSCRSLWRSVCKRYSASVTQQALLKPCCRSLFQVSLQMTNSPQPSEGSSNTSDYSQVRCKEIDKTSWPARNTSLGMLSRCPLDATTHQDTAVLETPTRKQQETCWWRPATPRVATDTLERIFW